MCVCLSLPPSLRAQIRELYGLPAATDECGAALLLDLYDAVRMHTALRLCLSARPRVCLFASTRTHACWLTHARARRRRCAAAQGFVDAYGDDTDQPATALSCLQARADTHTHGAHGACFARNTTTPCVC